MHEAIVKLETGIDVDLKVKSGWTLLWWAAKEGHEAIVRLLLETGKADADLKDKDGWKLLWWAAERGHGAIVKLLLNKVNADSMDGESRMRHDAIVKLLLETDKVDAAADIS